MTFILADRVKETATTTGTGDFTLAGAVSGFQAFDTPLNTGDTTYYAIVHQSAAEWETGIGTFTATSTLARTTVLESSNAGAAVNFSAGTKDVFIALPAKRALPLGTDGASATITSTDAGATAGPILTLYRDSASPAASDVIGQIKFDGEDSAGNQQTYATINTEIIDPTSTSEDGRLVLDVEGANAEIVLSLDQVKRHYFTDNSFYLVGATSFLGSSTNTWDTLYLSSGGDINFNSGDVTITHSANALTFAGATSGYNFDDGSILPATGTTTVAPVKFTSGTNLTTAEAGAMEYDGVCLYGTVDAGNRGVIPCYNIVRLDAARALTNTTTEQAFFDAANDTLTLELGTYRLEAFLSMSSMSATSGNAAFDILGAGTAVLGSVNYQTFGNDAAANATGAAVGGAHMTQGQTGASSVTAATATVVGIGIRGSFEIMTAGTIIPSISLVTAAAANADAGSFFSVYRIGSTTAVFTGQFS